MAARATASDNDEGVVAALPHFTDVGGGCDVRRWASVAAAELYAGCSLSVGERLLQCSRALGFHGGAGTRPEPLEEGQAREEEQAGDPGVYPQPQDQVGGVGAHQFEDEAPGGVRDDVEGEYGPGAERVTAVQEHQKHCRGQAPERFVEEGWLEVAEDFRAAAGSSRVGSDCAQGGAQRRGGGKSCHAVPGAV